MLVRGDYFVMQSVSCLYDWNSDKLLVMEYRRQDIFKVIIIFCKWPWTSIFNLIHLNMCVSGHPWPRCVRGCSWPRNNSEMDSSLLWPHKLTLIGQTILLHSCGYLYVSISWWHIMNQGLAPWFYSLNLSCTPFEPSFPSNDLHWLTCPEIKSIVEY